MSARPDQCWLTSRRYYLNCDSCLIYERVRTGNHVVRTVYQSSHIWTWKESEVNRSLMDVRTGCWDVRTDASWNRSFSIQWRVRTDDACLSGVWTVWTRRLEGWNSRQMGVRTGLLFVRTADRESEFFYLQWRVFWTCSDTWNLCLQHLYT